MEPEPESPKPAEAETAPAAAEASPVPAAPKRTRSARREQAAADVLRTFVRDIHEDRFGAVAPRNDEIDVTVRMKVKRGEAWELRFEPSLAEQLISQIEDAQARWQVYQPGHVYCFRCDSTDCEHALPPTPLTVFDGYEANGVPQWSELAQVLIAARDERVDRLFGKPAAVVARIQFGRDLKEKQLPSFGRSSRTYAILGQVVAGYFAPPASDLARLAVTFQAVEVRGEHGSIHLHLNMISRLPGNESLSDLLASGWQPGLLRARDTAAAALAEIEMRTRGARDRGQPEEAHVAMRQVPSVLHRLADSLERTRRQETRRTHHVEQRRHEQRPVHKAMEDCREAAPESFFFDEKTGATVVCGPQGRAHAFNAQGKHITSFVLRPEAIEFRLRTQRWRKATTEECAKLRDATRNP